MRYVREEAIRCVCGWAGSGFGGDPCPHCGSQERTSMSKEAPEDEMILAELIAVASAHGLRSCRGSLFRDKNGYNLASYKRIVRPPEGAVACCAVGASLLLSRPDTLDGIYGPDGNDAAEHELAPELPDASDSLDANYLRNWNIGAAFEIALRDPDAP